MDAGALQPWRRRGSESGDADAKGADAWRSVLNDGAMWGPGRRRLCAALRRPARLHASSACEFLTPRSAARWRRVRVLPLERYGPGRACPCSSERWIEVIVSLQDGKLAAPCCPDSLAAEMERRVAAVGRRPSSRTTPSCATSRPDGAQPAAAGPSGPPGGAADGDAGGSAHYDAAVAASAPLRCVPKPDSYGVPETGPSTLSAGSRGGGCNGGRRGDEAGQRRCGGPS